jgi:hypothetical protein
VVLEDHANLATISRYLAAFYASRILIVDDDLTVAGSFYESNQTQQGALASARVARYEYHLALIDRQAETGQCFLSAWISLCHIIELDHTKS